MITVVLLNHKGGVGKTTSAINIGSGLAKEGHRVLLVDFDPQANLTMGLGLPEENENLLEALIKDTDLKYVELNENLHVCTSSLSLSDAEPKLIMAYAREYKLKRALEKVENNFDYCIIDCPPSLGMLTTNALVASNYILIPVKPHNFSVKALGSISDIYMDVKTYLNPDLELLGMFLTIVEENTKIEKKKIKEVRDRYKDVIFDTMIRKNTTLAESVDEPVNRPIIEYAPKSAGAEDYTNLTKELIKRLHE